MKKKRVEVKERRENQGKNYSRTKAIKEKGKRFFKKILFFIRLEFNFPCKRDKNCSVAFQSIEVSSDDLEWFI